MIIDDDRARRFLWSIEQAFENVKIVAEKGVHTADCKNVRFKSTKLMSPSGEAFPSQDL